MESLPCPLTRTTTTLTLFPASKHLIHHFSRTKSYPLLTPSSLSSQPLTCRFNTVHTCRPRRLECLPILAGSFGTAAGGGGCGLARQCGGGRYGDSKPKLSAVADAGGEIPALSPDVIVLDVKGMTCGGCSSSVKKILESQSQVSSATVNLTSETAVVWPVSEAKVVTNWQQQLGEALAKHLTTCGFKSNLRVERNSVKKSDKELYY